MTDYPPNMVFRPLDGWPRDMTKDRRAAPFRASFSTTLNDLRQELHRLGTGGPRSWYQRDAYPQTVLQIALRDRDIRISDGMPRADAKVAHPGIVLNVESKHGALSYPCDAFDDWRDNLRAVTLGLEALRRLERYGITQTGQQYRGWLAIEATAAPRFATADLARKYLLVVADPEEDEYIGDDAAILRRARRNAHPDRNGGDQARWDDVQQAAAVLGLTEARAL